MGARSFRIVRPDRCDDVLTADGLYFRSLEGGLIFFSGKGLGMGTYTADEWASVHNLSNPDALKGDGKP